MNESFNFNQLMQESKDCLMKPKEYFSSMPISGGLTEPLIKALVYGAVAGGIYFFLGLLNLGIGVGILGAASGFMLLISAIIGSVFGVFVGGAIMLVVSTICKGNAEFEANVRVVASSMVIWPVVAVLGFLSGISLTVGLFVATAVGLYGIYLVYNGLVYSLKADEKSSRIAAYILAGLSVISLITRIT